LFLLRGLALREVADQRLAVVEPLLVVAVLLPVVVALLPGLAALRLELVD